MAKLQSDRYESYFHKIWMISLFLGQKLWIWDIKFKIYYMSKSIAKCQNCADISRAQKPARAKFLEFEFFLSEKTRLPS